MDRSVASMSSEQLYRKRAFDRANQRASRVRKKSRIQELEEEVAGLKRRLTRSEDLVKRLQHNQTCLRDIIKSACASLQTADHHIVSPFGELPTEPSISESTQIGVERDLSRTSSSPNITLGAEPQSEPATHGLSGACVSGSWTNKSTANVALASEASSNPAEEGLGRGIRTVSGSNLPMTAGDSIYNLWGGNSCEFGSQSSVNASRVLEANQGSTYSITPFGTDHLDADDEVSEEWSLPTDLPLLDVAESTLQPSVWERVPLHTNATCQLDMVFLQMITSCHQHLQSTGQLPETSFPNIRSLLDPNVENTYNPISNALGHHGKVSLAVRNLPERVACLYCMSLYLRWLVFPCKRNYEAMPDFLRPIRAQLEIPHPVWIDVVVWPEARKRILENMHWSDEREFHIFREITGRSLSIHWPYDTSTILNVISDDDLKLDPVFESHVRQLENWTVGPALAENFPFLDCVPTIH